MVYTHGAYTDSEKIKIIESNTLKNKWITALELSFCKAFGLTNPSEINTTNLTLKTFEQYTNLLQIIDDDLEPAINIRNRIAHGQWKYVFSSNLKNINNDLTNKLGQENILVLQYRLRLFQALTQIIHDQFLKKIRTSFHGNRQQRVSVHTGASSVSRYSIYFLQFPL